MEKLAAFVSEHINDDTTRLIMNKAKWPEIDMDLAVNCIESRRKLKGKVQEWCDEPHLIFPRRLSAEQCSSSATGRFKAEVAKKISRLASVDQNDSFKLADLTGGLGVDSWFFSQKASQVLYCEMLPELCRAAGHNFSVLGAENIIVKNTAVCAEKEISRLASLSRNDREEGKEASIFHSPEQILSDFQPDIVYMDPARRGEGGKKVFLIEDCTPDVLTLKDETFKICRNIFLKLSPMADITMVCERLGRTCREVYVVSAGGECKELLIWMDREWNDDYMIHAVELHKSGEPGIFSFHAAEEKSATSVQFIEKPADKQYRIENMYMFEPGKALMKAGAFNLISQRFNISKIGRSTHYYLFSSDQVAAANEVADITGSALGKDICTELKKYGKVFPVIRMEPLDKRSLKAAGKEFPHSEVTARNIPMDTETLRKKLGVTSGDDAHIFGLKSDSSGMLLIICSVIG